MEVFPQKFLLLDYLLKQVFEKLLKAAAVYQLPDLSAIGENGVIKLVVRDKKNDTSNEFGEVVGETDEQFTYNFKVENIKIIPGSYEVVISSKLLSEFSNSQHNLKYFHMKDPIQQDEFTA